MLPAAAALRRQIESALEQRIPGALTPRPRILRDLAATGIPELDTLLQGGFPIGAITELVGPQSSGRTTLALSVLAEMTAAGKVVAWVDASDTLDPLSAAAAGVDLNRQLWVRCGQNAAVSPAQQAANAPQKAPNRTPTGAPLLAEGNHVPVSSGGCGSPHPRGEAKGLSDAIDAFLQPDTFARAIPPRGPDPNRPNARKNRMTGTPGAPNRKLSSAPSVPNAFPHRASDRQEQIPTDRLPPRRGAHATGAQRGMQSSPGSKGQPSPEDQRKPKNLSAAQIAYTGRVAGAWNDNRNNMAGRAIQTAPNAIAAGLPRFREMEARAAGQGHFAERGPVTWKPSLQLLKPQPEPEPPNNSTHTEAKPSPSVLTPHSAALRPASLAGDPPRTQSALWKALDQALRATDLLLAAGGFSALVLDLASIPAEFSWRIPLATWFRFRSAAERARAVLLVLTQHPCARSSAELVLRLQPAQPQAANTVLTGADFHLHIDRQRFDNISETPTEPETPVHTLHLVSMRKPPQRARDTIWQRRAAWTGTHTATKAGPPTPRGA